MAQTQETVHISEIPIDVTSQDIVEYFKAKDFNLTTQITLKPA